MALKSASHPLKKGLTKVWRDWREQRFDRALAEVERLIRDRPDNAQLLVIRSQLIRLQGDEDGTRTLDDARDDLEAAATLDEQSPIPLIELGYFRYAIDDDAKAALTPLRRATARCRQLLRESLFGQAGALEELGRAAEAEDCLRQALMLSPRDGGTGDFPTDHDIYERLKDLRTPEA
jgi:tetratricopeptide (TPR) repeat protein